jgi:hypothetical protein
MKKMLLCFVAILAAGLLSAKDLSDYDYVVTSKATFYCEKIDFGLVKTKCVLNTGEVISLKNNEVIAYKKDGKIFEKLPLYSNNQETGAEVFMELVKYKAGMKLYKYSCIEEGVDKFTGQPYPAQPSCHMFVFNNGQYYLELNPKTCKTVFDFFELNM